MEAEIQLPESIIPCPICFEDINNDKIFSEINSCNHILCEICFKQLINYSNNCPLCSKIFTSCKYKKDQNTIVEEYILNERDLTNVKQQKESFFKGIK
jgi:hypothetical protein